MLAAKADIISRLRREILPLEGLYSPRNESADDTGLGFMKETFPNKSFPLGAVHELISESGESAAATAGFTAGILSGLMKNGSAAVWIGRSRILFPPALKMLGIRPDQIIFIDLQKEKDILWSMEEALKCVGLAAVIGEMPDISFTSSRRFQLAVEQSRVTGFILRSNPRNLHPNSCIARWKIRSLPGFSKDGLPGLGHPRWQVDLQKIRNGRPGSWDIEWRAGKFHEITESLPSILLELKRKTG
jgi:protein ImuA